MVVCLGVPMEVIALDGFNARCRAGGIEREVNLFLLQGAAVAPGDYVLVHVGYAIQKVDPLFAREARALYDQMAGGGGA